VERDLVRGQIVLQALTIGNRFQSNGEFFKERARNIV
jgi:hypothetical protein